jgi:hypothetical protein
MKKDLNIEEKCQRAIVVKPVNWEQRIGKEKALRDFAVSMALLNVKLRTINVARYRKQMSVNPLSTKSTTAK